MARTRLELSDILRSICTNCYYSPPSSLNYPCIIYQLSNLYDRKADNDRYMRMNRYSITLIDENPDSPYVEQLLRLQYCSFDRTYAKDNLNHWVFTLYF